MLYARALKFGLRPSSFWESTLGEVTRMMEASEQTDRLAWMRTSHELALTYNINRGKGKALEWEDFYPYAEQQMRASVPDMDDPRTAEHFKAMGNSLNNGN
jgi:hypothetical protein